jgi:hypothetical protein
MDRLQNLTDIDLEDAERKYGFVNIQSKTYILLGLPILRSGLYVAKAIEADSSASETKALVWLGWDCMDDFETGKKPPQVLTGI